MKNKGFTLVEMLAIIVILAILAGIVLLNFSSILSSTQDKVFKTYEESMRDSTIEYIVDTGNIPTLSSPLCVRLTTLTSHDDVNKSPAYLSKFNNPNSSDTCDSKSFIFVEVDPENANRNKTDSQGHTDNNKKFIYKVCLKCDNYTSEDCSKVTSDQVRNICGITG
jgi:prepilin-type N-terminal cleavage/methylation domain-containing protein